MSSARPHAGVRGAIFQARDALLLEPPAPLVCGGAGDAARLGRCRHAPTLLEDPRDEQQPAEWREPRPTMSHESLLPVRDSDKP
jgi:hypothetical protein